MLKTLQFLFLLIILHCVLPTGLKSQVTHFQGKEDTLAKIGNDLWKSRSDHLKLQLADSLFTTFISVLSQAGSFNYPFDSLRGISKLEAKNSDFRIFSWNTPFSNGTFRFDGIIQNQEGKLFPLTNTGALPLNRMNSKLASNDWYGAVYYALIEKEVNKKTVYTLLGWNGNTASSNVKIIDVLSFSSEGSPIFGDFIFKTAEGIKPRVVIEYAENANALVRFDLQKLLLKKGKRVKAQSEWMIVMDRLAPMAPNMEGIRKYYVPTGDTYDAYIFRDSFWLLAEDIMVANPSTSGKPSGADRK